MANWRVRDVSDIPVHRLESEPEQEGLGFFIGVLNAVPIACVLWLTIAAVIGLIVWLVTL